MNISKLRARPWGTALLFFVTGVLFASAMDWTPFSHAQGGGVSSKQMAQATKSLGETSDAFAAIAEHVTPAVVAIQTRTNARMMKPGQGQQIDPRIPKEFRPFIDPQGRQQIPMQEGTGSGFIISQDGYIITNNHVVQDADVISVVMTDRKTYKAKLIGRDPDTDVAVIKIDASGLPTIALGDDERLRIGEWVLAIGNPLGLDFTVTAGIVSAKGRGQTDVPVNSGRSYAITDFIQTDAAINPGNSGGPLVNIRGEVVGMNTAIASNTGRYEGYGFAIPVGLAKTVWEDLIEHGRVVRAALGVSIGDVTAEDADASGLKSITGVFVRECNATSGSSPACSAGVEAGDIITSIDGRTVDRVSALQRLVRTRKPGDVVDVKLMRYGKEKEYKVKLIQAKTDDSDVISAASEDAAKKNASPASKLGITVEPLSEQFAKANNVDDKYRGLQVTEVTADGPSRGKFQPGDVLVGVMPNGDRIKSESDLAKALSSKKPGDLLSLRVLHTDGANAGTLTVVNLRIGG